MSQHLIITTKEELTNIIKEVLLPFVNKQPDNVAELECLKSKEFLTTKEVEKLYGLNASSLRKHRVNGEGPEYIKQGKLVFYTHNAVRNYLESLRIRTYAT